MGQEITLAQIRQWLKAYAQRIKEQEDYLTQLDAAIGDADHGANMYRGLHKVSEKLADPEFPHDDINSLLRAVAMTLISSVGGAAGPLYGAFFLRAAQVENLGDTITLPELAAMVRAGLEGIQQRGKAQVGDKTMVDALHPAVQALEAAAQKCVRPSVCKLTGVGRAILARALSAIKTPAQPVSITCSKPQPKP